MPTLFDPVQAGDLHLKNRIVMAPLTRNRSPNAIPRDITATYYAQRADAGLLITEATAISHQGQGYADVPGLYGTEQLDGWKKVTAAVHAKGGTIVTQLWHVGRVSHTELQPDGGAPVAPSAITAKTKTVLIKDGVPTFVETSHPRALKVTELPGIVHTYAAAARNAVETAGFDGVEIHGANGYLVDQFIQDKVNRRTDAYGGSIEKRSRFAVEVASAIVDAVGADRVGIRLSPFSEFQGMKMDDPIPQFTHLLKSLKPLKLAYIHVVQTVPDDKDEPPADEKVDFAVDAWDNTSPVIIAGNFKAASAARAVDENFSARDVVIAFGRPFLATPDIVFRLKNGMSFNPYDRSTFYLPKSEKGYIDQPFSKEFERARTASKLS